MHGDRRRLPDGIPNRGRRTGAGRIAGYDYVEEAVPGDLVGRAEGKNTEGISAERAAVEAAEGVSELVRGLGLSKRLRDYGIKKDDLARIAREAAGPESADALLILERIW